MGDFPVPSSLVPLNNFVFSAFFEFAMKKSGPKIIWKRASYFQLFKISWLLQKQITCYGIFYLLELMNLFKKHLCPAIFDGFEGNFTRAL